MRIMACAASHDFLAYCSMSAMHPIQPWLVEHSLLRTFTAEDTAYSVCTRMPMGVCRSA